MVKSDIISAMKANRLYWLGRYEERVYLTLHLLRKCYDKMIDGEVKDYEAFWLKLDATNSYQTPKEFSIGMMYDEKNPCSIISELNCAKDNAILLREDITSETLSYIEMSTAFMKRCSEGNETNITKLQPVTDWALAFWGSAMQRVNNPKVTGIMLMGKYVEEVDMLIRFGYPFERIYSVYEKLIGVASANKSVFDSIIEKQLKDLLTEFNYNNGSDEYKFKVLKYINHLVLL